MAVNLSPVGELPSVAGITPRVGSAGIKTPGRKDLVVFELAPSTVTAGVFTQNRFCAAPVHVCKDHLAKAQPRAWVINTGNANAGTGEQGMRDAYATCDAVAQSLGVNADQVLPFSTGVIGEYLPMSRLLGAVPSLPELSSWRDAAEGIMTTDTMPKGASVSVELPQGAVTITGISKGAGMIQPNMATMLAFVATDAAIEPDVLDAMLRDAVGQSFNRITVDSDTSTNDSCVMAATGASGVSVSADDVAFVDALNKLNLELAQAIVRDGEGATKFVEVAVKGALSTEDAVEVAYTVAHSPLVKTALFASDPNWGRILAAVGRARIDSLSTDSIDIYLGDVQIVAKGQRASSYTEEAGQAVMDQTEIKITIDLGAGDYADRVFTSDLSHDYVTINAEYRT